MEIFKKLKSNHEKNTEIRKIIKEYNVRIKNVIDDIYDHLNFHPYCTDGLMELTIQLKNLQEERDKKIQDIK